MLSKERRLRFSAGIPTRRMPNTAAPANAASRGIPFDECAVFALAVAAVELIVIVAAAALAPAMVAEVGRMLQAGGYFAPAGDPVSAQVRLTGPVNPPIGDTITLEVLPVVAPGAAIVLGAPLTLKGSVSADITVEDTDA